MQLLPRKVWNRIVEFRTLVRLAVNLAVSIGSTVQLTDILSLLNFVHFRRVHIPVERLLID
jgi:hypothetical protein